MVDIQFKIHYDHDRSKHLLAYHDTEDYLLIYSLSEHKLERFSFNVREVITIDISTIERLLNLEYST